MCDSGVSFYINYPLFISFISINLYSNLNLYVTILINNKFYPLSWFITTIVILISSIVIFSRLSINILAGSLLIMYLLFDRMFEVILGLTLSFI